MASIVSKLARAADATRASTAAVGDIAGGSRPISPCLPRLYLTGGAIRGMCSGVSPAGGPKSEEEKDGPKSEGAVQAAMINPETYLAVDEISLKSKEALWALYEYWCKYHGITRDRAEMAHRIKIFRNTARFVHKVNNSGGSCKLTLSRFADQTQEEKFSPRSRIKRRDFVQGPGGDD